MAWEREDSTALHATTASGRYEPAFRALPWRQIRLSLGADVPTHAFIGGTELNFALRVDGVRGHRLDFSDPTHDFLRGFADAEVTRVFDTKTLVLRTLAGGVTHSDHFKSMLQGRLIDERDVPRVVEAKLERVSTRRSRE